MNTFLVMIGGAVGAAARFHLGGALGRGAAFPWGTLVVNIVGGLLMGLLMARDPGDGARLLIGVGLLGGFTTFSAFSLETVRLFEGGAAALALAYVAASVIGACVALWLGLALGRAA
ncbi:CrcB family protein [Sphingomonas sp. ID1715]|uniref:fluoride efflux transporter FluC n=1 Tax=Sphingomonas sp. ID1715 TaxID=1656898 RepID=UPI001489F85E|nr:CrcB family protein [Sphingomonas sp. ID1715]NNM76955.1 CrcB family protein [Sphingomonas sp. ID1715]